MVEESWITDEMRKEIGSLLNVVVTEVERGAIRRFCKATGDENPLWQDEDYARGTNYGGTVVPSGYLITMQMEDTPIPYLASYFRHLAAKGGMDVGGEWEFFRQVRPGDTITVDRKLADFYEKRGSLGQMLFVVFETTYRNQRDEIVAKGRWSDIRIETPEAADYMREGEA